MTLKSPSGLISAKLSSLLPILCANHFKELGAHASSHLTFHELFPLPPQLPEKPVSSVKSWCRCYIPWEGF